VTDPTVGGDAGGPIDWTGGGSADPPPADPDPGASGVDGAGPADRPPAEAVADDVPVTDDVPVPDDEVIIDDIVGLEATVEAERDDYLERLQRLQAEFENYRRRMTKEQAEARDRGAQALAAELLPVLDGFEAALQQGSDEAGPIHSQIVEILTKAGLERTGEPGDPFDPEIHEAVMHEPAEDGAEGESTIAELLRTGYSWKGRVLRPAMVKVRG
jgi:molecular chaperone GrpE